MTSSRGHSSRCPPRGIGLDRPPIVLCEQSMALPRTRTVDAIPCLGESDRMNQANEEESGEFVVRLRSEQWQDVLDAVRSGDLTALNEARDQLRSGRSDLLNAMGRATTDRRRTILSELLIESRSSEEDLSNAVRAAQDTVHAERMANLSEASNGIAERAEVTAKALKLWTIVLAGSTGVLAVATIALIFATLSSKG